MEITGTRYSKIWSALSSTVGRRQRVEDFVEGWFNFPQRANAMITELEDELASVNRTFLYVPGITIFSFEDDHQRLRSKAVAQFPAMCHINNPQKALGPLNNAICSALNPVFLASHYSRPGEKLIHVCERLVRLIQGVTTSGPVRPMVDSIFASDRGYNVRAKIDDINDRLDATGLVYRESFSGRIAAIYHNNDRLFSATKFTLIPRAGHQKQSSSKQRELFHLVFEGSVTTNVKNDGYENDIAVSLPRMKVSPVISRVDEIKLLQSQDPGWFLSRAFQFTSHNYDELVACEVEIKTMTALNTIEAARQRRHSLAPITYINDIGQNEESLKQFQALVPSTEYRIQCVHHALSFNLNYVMFVLTKGSNCGVGQVIYIAILEFHKSLKAMYSYILGSIHVGAFEWVGKGASAITNEYDDLLQTSHASDLHSYASYYSLSQAYKTLARNCGTLPPARMIRPTAFVYCNYLKGGVNEFSRAMTSLCYKNSGENPIVSIIGRFLCAQVNNAAVVHCLSVARRKGRLPDQFEEMQRKGV
ncbi:unnamed protein product [Agarophyton chilense]